MRIAHVTDSYLPRVGGIEMHVHDLATQQCAAGHDAVVLTAAASDVPRGDVPVLAFPGPSGPLRLHDYPALHRAVVGGGFDVVHAHLSLISPVAWVAIRAAARAAVPVVVTMHSVAPDVGQLASLLRVLDARRGVTWTAVSEVAAAPLRLALPGRQVTVLPNGIEPGDWQLPPRRWRGRPLTVVSVGRLTRRKRVVPLVEVLARVRDLVPASQPLRAVVVGSGPQTAAVSRAVRRHGIADWVELTGQLSHPAIRHLLAESDVFLAPARSESFGLAALQARCAGLPVVAMACGGVGEFVRDGVEGRLVADDAEMADATAAILTAPVALQRLQEHNRSVTPTMAWGEVVAQNLAAYAAAGAGVRQPVAP
ncbi:MAG: glycosyltransferase family 4 protein [Actinomycetota bacterium]